MKTLSEVTSAEVRAQLARGSTTREDFAAALGVSIPTARGLISGHQEWKLNQITTVASVFGMTVSDLITEALAHAEGVAR
jgi:hypothetical protein